MIIFENLYIEKGLKNPFSKYMSFYAIKRKSNKAGKKVSNLYFHIYIHSSIFSLLEIYQSGYKRDSTF